MDRAMARRDFHNGRVYADMPSEPAGPGFLFGIGLTFAWLRLQLGSLLRPRAS
jgi:hypothetical protein